MAIFLKNACYIHPDSLEFRNTNILVEEGLDASINFHDNVGEINSGMYEQVIDCHGKFVTKSFANGHHHIYSALAKGMPAPKTNPKNFVEVLKYVWWNIDKKLDPEIIEASAFATAIACARAGSTFVIDHHASPNYIRGSLDIIAKVFDKVGINHLLCYEISDRDGHDKALQGIAESRDYLERNQGLIGLHASFTVEQETLDLAVELMKDSKSGIHIHVAEDLADQDHCMKKYHKRVVERLNDAGVLKSSKTLLAHCLHLDENERKILRESPVYIVENMESNLNNNVGFFNAQGLNKNIMLGTDGMHSEMIRSAQAAFFAGQFKDEMDYKSLYKRFRKVHHYVRENQFKGDGDNNLVVLDYQSPTEMNEKNFLGHFVFGLRDAQVEHVISNGKLILKDRLLQNINEEELNQFTRTQAKRLWDVL